MRLLPEALEVLAATVGREWLERELNALGDDGTNHPLLKNVRDAHRDFLRGEEALHGSTAVRWVISLAQDVTLARDRVVRLADRLRSSNDCEPTKYELQIMGAYIRAGENVHSTDAGGVGEFRVERTGQSAYVECKYKSDQSVRDRHVAEIFRKATVELRAIMERTVFADVRVVFRSDPDEGKVAEVIELIERALLLGVDHGKTLRSEGIKVLLLPYTGNSIKIPRGYDSAEAMGRVKAIQADGKPVLGDLWSVAWRSIEPTGWTKSALVSLKKAAKQLPREAPGLIYLELPTGPEEMIVGRMALLTQSVRQWLTKNKRINAIVLTGQSPVTLSVDGMIFARTKYRPTIIENPIARTALPQGFPIPF